MARSVIVAGARTPIAKLNSDFAMLSGADLGAIAIREALRRAQVAPDQVDYVIMGQVLRGGTGQITARQASIGAGIPQGTPALNIDKVCLSGMSAIALAHHLIRAGEAETIVAGGMESMSRAPYVLPKARTGSRLGDSPVVDSMIYDGLWSTFTETTMGESSDEVNRELGISREEQDRWAAHSHSRAHAAWEQGRLEDEVVEVGVETRDGTRLVRRDEGIRPDSTYERLASLAPAFGADGTITAGNASQLSDGAAAVVVTSSPKAHQLPQPPLAEIVGHGMFAGAFPRLHTVPAAALRRAMEKTGLDIDDMGLFEVNEAFAAVAVSVIRILAISEDDVNVNGGAVALGHPIGMSGARLVLALAHEMRRRSTRFGGAMICGGGGQGEALIICEPGA